MHRGFSSQLLFLFAAGLLCMALLPVHPAMAQWGQAFAPQQQYTTTTTPLPHTAPGRFVQTFPVMATPPHSMAPPPVQTFSTPPFATVPHSTWHVPRQQIYTVPQQAIFPGTFGGYAPYQPWALYSIGAMPSAAQTTAGVVSGLGQLAVQAATGQPLFPSQLANTVVYSTLGSAAPMVAPLIYSTQFSTSRPWRFRTGSILQQAPVYTQQIIVQPVRR